MKPYNDFTFLFQGPLHKNFIHGLLNNYSEYTNNIIVSHWDNDDPELLKYLTSDQISCKLITSKFHTNYNVYNQQNVYYQTFTMLNGIREINTKFTLKLRTDQWFGNLVPILNKIREFPDKLICANLHFRPDSVQQYHPSDKLYGSNSILIKKTIEIMYHRITKNVQPLLAGAYMYTDDREIVSEERLLEDIGFYDHSTEDRNLVTVNKEKPLIGTIKVTRPNYIGTVPEVILGTSFLMAKGIYPDPTKSIEIVKENFDIVRIEDMTPYVNKEGNNQIEHVGIEIGKIEQYG